VPVCPSEYSAALLADRRCRPTASARNSLLVQSFRRSEVPRLLVTRSRFAVRPTAGCAVFPHFAAPATVKRPMHPLFEFHVPPAYCPTHPSPSTAVDRHLSWAFAPFSTSRHGGPLNAGLPSPLRSAFRVWLPSWRLTPAEPVPVLSHTGSAHGIHPSELSPPGRYPPVSRTEEPTCRFSRRFLPPPKQWAGPTDRGSWALTLPRVPGDQAGFNSPATGGSLGFRPS
jgi:hypothetical protein